MDKAEEQKIKNLEQASLATIFGGCLLVFVGLFIAFIFLMLVVILL